MALHIDAIEGLTRLACTPYDETIVDWIKTLPERHYRRDSQEWSVPARREHLRNVCGVIAELEQRGNDVDITEPAAARLSRLDVGRGVLRRNAIEIAGPIASAGCQRYARCPSAGSKPSARSGPFR